MLWTGFIPESRIEELKFKVAKLNKRAAKIGVAPISVELTGQMKRDETDYPHVCIMFEIILNGETPKFDGWKLLAVLQHDPNLDANIVKTVPGETIPEGYRTRPGVCDHCGYTRIRKETFVVQHDGGDVKQVGRQCVADFLGHGDPRRFVKTYEWFAEAAEWGHGYSGLRDDRETFSLEAFVAMTNAVIRRYGWVSSAKAYETGNTSTATEVLEQLNSTRRAYLKRDQLVDSLETDVEYAKKVILWAKSIVPNGDYEHNLLTIAKQEYVIKKTWGFAASMIAAYKRATVPKVERKVSNHYGTVGEKVDLNLNFLRDFAYDSNWGVVHFQNFKDDNGNLFVWAASRNQGLDAGQEYKVTGTIKQHKEYKDIKQTILTRCKVGKVR